MTGALTVEEVLPDVWRLQVPLAFLEPPEVSLYLLRTPDGDVLVDAGMPGSEDAVEDALDRAGSSRSRITQTVVTHEHPDHLGLAVWIGAPVSMHPLTRELLALFVNADPGRYSRLLDRYWLQAEDIPDPSMFNMFRAMLSIPDASRDVNDGDVVAGGWTAVWTPGHSPGHLCLYHAGHRALIAGDHVLPGYTPHVGMDPFHDDPVGAFVDSLLRVATLDVDVVLPGHGEPFTDLQAGVDALTGHHAKRLARIEAAVREPRTVREVTDEVFRVHESPMDSIMAVIEAGAHLLHLELVGKVKRVDGRRWVATRDAAVIGSSQVR
jgi:glyoxylase-like metal-dependent hydrolase (beta-lactamase superfamily II)